MTKAGSNDVSACDCLKCGKYSRVKGRDRMCIRCYMGRNWVGILNSRRVNPPNGPLEEYYARRAAALLPLFERTEEYIRLHSL